MHIINLQEVIKLLIKPSTALRNEYNNISVLCKEMLDLREKLLSVEANRLSGAKTYTITEVSERLRRLIDIDGNL